MSGSEPAGPQGERLQKVLARAGVGSRRYCEILIDRGRVSVNGRVVDEQGVRVRPDDEIRVDGGAIPRNSDAVVLMMNKPAGVVTSMSDEQGRTCVGDLVADRPERLFHVGRLDAETTGLLLLTNDGELANRLSHPRHEVTKTYRATIAAPVPAAVGRQLVAGVELDDGPTAADAFRVVAEEGGRAIVEIRLHSGRNRIVRRMLSAVGHPVQELVRTQLGPLQLGSLKPGEVRQLSLAQIRSLYAATDPGH
jgi:23S rRNA pseudouridine2605 synthase